MRHLTIGGCVMSIYEVILASYQDSNNDGNGDIQGLRQRLDYLQFLGIKVIWLIPIFVISILVLEH